MTPDPRRRAAGTRPDAVDLPPLPTTPRSSPAEPVEFRLAVLDCPTCGAPLDAEAADVVFYCTACRSGYQLARPRDGHAPTALTPLDVAFLSTPEIAAERWFPFWRLPATVRIEARAGAAGKVGLRDIAMLTKLFTAADDRASPRIGDAITFAIPAFAADIVSLQRLIYEYTYRAPDRGDRIGERLTGGVYGVRDAEKLAHYALITAEIRRPSTLRNLSYQIDFGEPSLLGVPALRHGDGWRDGLFSVPFRDPAGVAPR